MSVYDDADNDMFGDMPDDAEEPEQKKEQMFVNTKWASQVTNAEMLQWIQWRNDLTYTQGWQDIAMNPATGSTFIVSTQ
jgi:hypothetical protein